MILQRYRNVKILGRGAYGEVLLVQDSSDQGKQYALKLINAKKINDDPMLQEYLSGEIKCMMQMDSPYIMKLYQTYSDDQYHYLLCEYCNMGDLINYQAKLPNKIFTLQKTTSILADVISGLQILHSKGYLHRDIKPQNILVHFQNGKENFKLADFGFCKKKTQTNGTVLGTENYMSPEIYRQEDYGYEVDMWAFGILMFFMLNMSFPFKINPRYPLQKKYQQLHKMATNFSYREASKNSRKQNIYACTDEVEDLFRKMLNPNQQQRITFYEIRKHPLFKKYFSSINNQSKLLYASKFRSRIAGNSNFKSGSQLQSLQAFRYSNIGSLNVHSTAKKQLVAGTEPVNKKNSAIFKLYRHIDKNFPAQKEILEHEKDKCDFLYMTSKQFMYTTQFFAEHEILCMIYNLNRYYLILIRKFRDSMEITQLNSKYPSLDWKGFIKTNEFKKFQKQTHQTILKVETQLAQYYGLCQTLLEDIQELNPKFKSCFKLDFEQTQFTGIFKDSYRTTTAGFFLIMRAYMRVQTTKRAAKISYIICLVVICHSFNRIFENEQDIEIIFKEYFVNTKKTVNKLDYNELRKWLQNNEPMVLNQISKRIINLYFDNK